MTSTTPSIPAGSGIGGIMGGQKQVAFGAVPPYFSSSCERWTMARSSSGELLSEYVYSAWFSADKKLRRIPMMPLCIQVKFTMKSFWP